MKPITIAQSAAESKLAFEIHRNAQLESVRLAKVECHSRNPTELVHQSVTVDFKFRAERQDAPPNILRLLVSFQVTAMAEQSTGREAAERQGPNKRRSRTDGEIPLLVEASFETDYSLRHGYVPPDEAVCAFKDGNAIFNVWPYFRELLQSVTTRMGHPALTAPFLKLHPKPEPKETDNTVNAEPAPKAAPSKRLGSRRPVRHVKP
ncbi:MAG: hypothetical protein KJZ70_17405 [Bryobacterales bacterium]|nr:hypothetical protein [Bryobacterales bacterium]